MDTMLIHGRVYILTGSLNGVNGLFWILKRSTFSILRPHSTDMKGPRLVTEVSCRCGISLLRRFARYPAVGLELSREIYDSGTLSIDKHRIHRSGAFVHSCSY